MVFYIQMTWEYVLWFPFCHSHAGPGQSPPQCSLSFQKFTVDWNLIYLFRISLSILHVKVVVEDKIQEMAVPLKHSVVLEEPL